MASLDTNVLVRLLVKDDERQAAQARKLIRAASDRGETMFVPITVVLELEWVLRSVYEMPKSAILGAFVALLETRELVFQSEPAIERALAHFRKGFAGFSDCIHLGICGAESELPLLTFDRKAGRMEGVHHLGAAIK
ncbi:MAG: type II toxin-antitoxin system VapC family toxin [Abyssibacter sp.]|uniref:PIN domain-containing protein n=1 Tax=Abyssibacter sp. TaxID=2320200 RepID=UPI00321A58DD